MQAGALDWRQRVELGAAQASSGETDAAFASLRDAVERGWRDTIMLELNPLFESLREHADYRTLLEDIRTRVASERRELAFPRN